MFKILEGALYWRQGDYPASTAAFYTLIEASEGGLPAGAEADQAEEAEDSSRDALPYALAGLASSYLMQGELDAALRLLQRIPESAPPAVRFVSAYNAGVVSFQRGDFQSAAAFFREALTIDRTSVDAKINLELALSFGPAQVKEGEQELIAAEIGKGDAQAAAAENALFSLIREAAQKRWKNSPGGEGESDALDY
jgi:Ca-activated chloride channel family protein